MVGLSAFARNLLINQLAVAISDSLHEHGRAVVNISKASLWAVNNLFFRLEMLTGWARDDITIEWTHDSKLIITVYFPRQIRNLDKHIKEILVKPK